MPPPPDDLPIQHVTDTAIWVAHYRALESVRPDALFHDDLAAVLTGERGRRIAEALERRESQSMTRWSVIIRTVVIDRLIQRLVAEGVDTVINLGAGLDTRPYRLALPASLHWIEVDYPDMIAHKEKVLTAHRPGVQLERIPLDLADVDERRKLFARLGAGAQRALILTEGVVVYLTEAHVTSLAEDLHAQPSFQYWIGEYFAPQLYGYFQSPKRASRFKNAPFQFFPADWMGLFRSRGWTPHDIKYLGEEGKQLGRPMRLPWWARILIRLSGRKKAAGVLKLVAYVVFRRSG
ncbi:MAG TPA: SAM-dependent methyltransferase [Verrucomicrobiales bacterium]|jgi:methyltransferase (TIGR00027 family)|nr:SAM-dependent methyltransferase [Verrucomicrobiales bacterium]